MHTGPDPLIKTFERRDPRLGRVQVLDARSLAYMVERIPMELRRPLRSVVHERPAPILNQGDLGACTGFAGTGWLGSCPALLLDDLVGEEVPVAEAEEYARGLYSQATALDPFEGEWPPDDTGSSGLAICKALRARGLISSYRWASTLRGFVTLLQDGPVLLGMPWYECVVPGTRVLTRDLEWLPVEKLSPGESVIGFDEHGGRTAAYRKAYVESNVTLVRPSMEVTTDRGSVTVSENHRFLCTHRSYGRSWVYAKDLKEGQHIVFFGEPWEPDRSWEAGWLAGFYDGEGSLAGDGHRPGWSNLLTCSQKPGPTLDFALKILDAKGYDYGMRINRQTGVHCWYLRGENVKSRFLGEIRPGRLLARSDLAWRDFQIGRKNARAAVVQQVRPIGREEVHAVKTTTGSLITEGFLSHNCFFEPTSEGRIDPAGWADSEIYGGHEVLVRGVTLDPQQPGDLERAVFLADNSWGPEWGVNGRFTFGGRTYNLMRRDCDLKQPVV